MTTPSDTEKAAREYAEKEWDVCAQDDADHEVVVRQSAKDFLAGAAHQAKLMEGIVRDAFDEAWGAGYARADWANADDENMRQPLSKSEALHYFLKAKGISDGIGEGER